jgi:hypothetical protein
MSSRLSVRYYKSYSELPESFSPLLEQANEKGFFHTQPWFQFLLEHMWESDELRLYTVEDASGLPLLLAPLRLTIFDGAVPYAKTLASIGHKENYSVLCLLFNPAVDIPPLQVLTTLFEAIRHPKRYDQPHAVDVLRLWPVAAESELAALVGQALRKSGYWVQPYANSFNRFENTSGLSFDEYFNKRTSKQRYNVKNRVKKLEETGTLDISFYTGDGPQEELQRGIDGYVLGTVESWKSPASMASRSMLKLIRLAAEEGCLRLAVMKLEERPVAAQFWIVAGGVAHSMRVGYNEDYKKMALGTVLTKHTLEYLLDRDKVDEIDFGYGNETYKKVWMKDSRDYSGFIAFNPATPRGVFFAAKHIVGQPVKRFIARVLRLILRPLFGR